MAIMVLFYKAPSLSVLNSYTQNCTVKTVKNTKVQFGKYIIQKEASLCGNKRAGAPTQSGPTAPVVNTITSQKTGPIRRRPAEEHRPFPWDPNLHSKIMVETTDNSILVLTPNSKDTRYQVPGTRYNVQATIPGFTSLQP